MIGTVKESMAIMVSMLSVRYALKERKTEPTSDLAIEEWNHHVLKKEYTTHFILKGGGILAKIRLRVVKL